MMRRRRSATTLAVIALSLTPPSLAAQPGTDIFLARLTIRDGHLSVSGLRRATDRDGYDNQPQFLPGGRAVLYTSARPDGQTEIFRYDVESGATERVTRTSESEYSPTSVPGQGAFSVVRVEGDSTQRLWKFDLDGRNPRLVVENVAPVGYHAWPSPTVVALFVLGTPPTLQLADLETGRAEVVARNIGRSLHRIPGQDAVSFVHKLSEDDWRIRRLDLDTREITDLVATLPGREDYAWAAEGVAIMGRESSLYQWARGDAVWSVVADLAELGVQGITRLAVSPAGDWIAIVGDRATTPGPQ